MSRVATARGRSHADVTLVDKLSVDGVIYRGTVAFFRNFVRFVAVAAILFAVPVIWTILYDGSMTMTLAGLSNVFFGGPVVFAMVTFIVAVMIPLILLVGPDVMGMEVDGLLIFLAWLFAYFWFSIVVICGVTSRLRGEKLGVRELLVESASALVPVFFVALIVGILAAVIADLPILVFGNMGTRPMPELPGTIVLVFFWAAVPAAAVEQQGLLHSLKRSLQLTKGCRMRVFTLLLVLFVVGVVLTLGFFVAGTVWFGIALQVLFCGIGASIAAVGYHELRLDKDGVGREETARVFD